MSDYPWLLPELDPCTGPPVDGELAEFLETNSQANMRVLAEVNVNLYDGPKYKTENNSYAGYLLSLVVVDEMMTNTGREELPAWVNLVNRNELILSKQVVTIGTTSMMRKIEPLHGLISLDVDIAHLVEVLCEHLGLPVLDEDRYFAQLHIVR